MDKYLKVLSDNELKVYNLTKERKNTKEIVGILGIKLHEVKSIQSIVYKKLGIQGKIDIYNNRFNTLIPIKNRKQCILKRKSMTDVLNKNQVIRYRKLRDLGCSCYTASYNMSKKRFDKFLEENNMKG
jgi:DNA-binding CsgD family transcriptional regulator